MPLEDQSPRGSTSSRSEGRSSRASSSRQRITFVDSQDPNNRSAIQRHTAHHSNAQRRDARVRSLRSDRPRLLEWQRRTSAEMDALSLTSAQTSASSTSVSPAPRVPEVLPTTTETPADLIDTPAPVAERVPMPQFQGEPEEQPGTIASFLPEAMVESCKCDAPSRNST